MNKIDQEKLLENLSTKEGAENVLEILAKSFFHTGNIKTAKTGTISTQEKFKELIERLPVVIFLAPLSSFDTQELFVSSQIEKLMGFSPKEWLSDPIRWYYQIHEEDRGYVSLNFSNAFIEGFPLSMQFRVYDKNNNIKWIQCDVDLISNDEGEPAFLQSMGFDITELKNSQLSLEKSVKQKEALLKEVHHRVKNNLQVISSLLNLQAAKVKDPSTREVFEVSSNRIEVIADLHKQLYNDDQVDRLNLSNYINNLYTNNKIIGSSKQQVDWNIELEEIWIDIDQSVPLGLVFNEVLSNSIKHSNKPILKISVKLYKKESLVGGVKDLTILEITDNGPGLSEGWKQSDTLGMKLIQGLVNQIDGEIEFTSSDSGLKVVIKF